jgi:hypothetical protein
MMTRKPGSTREGRPRRTLLAGFAGRRHGCGRRRAIVTRVLIEREAHTVMECPVSDISFQDVLFYFYLK